MTSPVPWRYRLRGGDDPLAAGLRALRLDNVRSARNCSARRGASSKRRRDLIRAYLCRSGDRRPRLSRTRPVSHDELHWPMLEALPCWAIDDGLLLDRMARMGIACGLLYRGGYNFSRR